MRRLLSALFFERGLSRFSLTETSRYDPDGMEKSPVVVRFELAGWELFFAELEKKKGSAASLSELRSSVAESVRETLRLEDLSKHPPIAAVRRLFKEAGCDPSRYRASSEALIRRLLKGEAIPSIHPLVDINNCLSARLAVPCCVMAKGSFSPPFVFRAGRAGETYESLRGPFRLERKPLLVDSEGRRHGRQCA
jgi:DNA/RNA-binding domain of Phe-tRNA-synthetase-like protein